MKMRRIAEVDPITRNGPMVYPRSLHCATTFAEPEKSAVMAPLEKKRTRDGAFRSQKSRKRQKSNSEDHGSSNQTASKDLGKPVSIEDLSWSEVTLPDRFEDAEGFFGLEEIEGVEVVRPAGGEKVQYLVCSGYMACEEGY